MRAGAPSFTDTPAEVSSPATQLEIKSDTGIETPANRSTTRSRSNSLTDDDEENLEVEKELIMGRELARKKKRMKTGMRRA